MKIIEPEIMMQMRTLFDAGNGIRATARIVGLHRDTVAKYYHLGEEKKCPCGKSMTHRGWRSSRVARSPGRQQFLARTRPIKETTKTRWVNLKEINDGNAASLLAKAQAERARHRKEISEENRSLGPERLIEIVHDAIYTRCIPLIREDVSQDLLEILLIGDLDARDLKASPIVSRVINRNYRLSMPASNISLNEPFGDNRIDHIENLSADTLLFHYAAVTK